MNVCPTCTLAVGGPKCHAPAMPLRVTWATNLSNDTPPLRTHVPGPIAALKVSGSQASCMVTRTSCRPREDAVAATDPEPDALPIAAAGEGVVCWLAVGDAGLSQPAT